MPMFSHCSCISSPKYVLKSHKKHWFNFIYGLLFFIYQGWYKVSFMDDLIWFWRSKGQCIDTLCDFMYFNSMLCGFLPSFEISAVKCGPWWSKILSKQTLLFWCGCRANLKVVIDPMITQNDFLIHKVKNGRWEKVRWEHTDKIFMSWREIFSKRKMKIQSGDVLALLTMQ